MTDDRRLAWKEPGTNEEFVGDQLGIGTIHGDDFLGNYFGGRREKVIGVDACDEGEYFCLDLTQDDSIFGSIGGCKLLKDGNDILVAGNR